jgi:hypothetical protein
MKTLGLIVVCVGSVLGSGHETHHRYCKTLTGIKESYCRYYDPKPLCHRSRITCYDEEVARWATIIPKERKKRIDSTKTKKPKKMSKSTTAPKRTKPSPASTTSTTTRVTTRTQRSPRDATQTTTPTASSRRTSSSTTTTSTTSLSPWTATSATPTEFIPSIQGNNLLWFHSAEFEGSESPEEELGGSETIGSGGILGQIREGFKSIFGVNSAKAGDSYDPCSFGTAVRMGKAPGTKAGIYYMSTEDMRKCLSRLEISHFDAIFTLHNLYYGIAETYSFTDIVTNTHRNGETDGNVCGYKIHKVEVDLIGALRTELREYNRKLSGKSVEKVNRFLELKRPAYEFHMSLVSLFNKLHDAHTFYSSPFEMFRVFFPINFGSRMSSDGRQIVTLRTSQDKQHPLGRLVEVYKQVFGSWPIRPGYADSEILELNGLPAIDFLRQLVGEDGPLACMYQQTEQRLNAFVFGAPILVLAQVISPLPVYDSLNLKFVDGREVRVNLLGQFSDFGTSELYSTPNLMSTAALNAYTNNNAAFDAFIANEPDAEEKKATLWKTASAKGSKKSKGHIGHSDDRSWMKIGAKHKALLDPMNNLMRDHLLYLPPIMDSDEAGDFLFGEDDELFTLVALYKASAIPDARTLEQEIERAVEPRAALSSNFKPVGDFSYSFNGDVVVVRVKSMITNPNLGKNHYFFTEFVRIQQAAKERGITRLLFDVSGNGGGFVMSAYALMWYTMSDQRDICAPLRKRMTSNWQTWIESFGGGIEGLVDTYLVPQGEALVDQIDTIFTDLVTLVTVLYDGFGFTHEHFSSVTKAVALEQVHSAKRRILAVKSKAQQAEEIVRYIRNRSFIPVQARVLRDSICPRDWSNPFDPKDLVTRDDSMEIYLGAEMKSWGGRAAMYSKPSEFSFCKRTLGTMPSVASGYEFGYWSQIAFVSDGTCGSACALFTQGLQSTGDAVAFTYGGIAGTALDVASYAGGNVEEYEDFWPKLSFAAKVGKIASGGNAPWIKAQLKTWVASPIAFPTTAKARFNHNMMFVKAMGDNALPRQFYIMPGRKHFNIWGSDEESRTRVYDAIAKIPDWGTIPSDFARSHGQCPLESTPFSRRKAH